MQSVHLLEYFHICYFLLLYISEGNIVFYITTLSDSCSSFAVFTLTLATPQQPKTLKCINDDPAIL